MPKGYGPGKGLSVHLEYVKTGYELPEHDIRHFPASHGLDNGSHGSGTVPCAGPYTACYLECIPDKDEEFTFEIQLERKNGSLLTTDLDVWVYADGRYLFSKLWPAGKRRLEFDHAEVVRKGRRVEGPLGFAPLTRERKRPYTRTASQILASWKSSVWRGHIVPPPEKSDNDRSGDANTDADDGGNGEGFADEESEDESGEDVDEGYCCLEEIGVVFEKDAKLGVGLVIGGTHPPMRNKADRKDFHGDAEEAFYLFRFDYATRAQLEVWGVLLTAQSTTAANMRRSARLSKPRTANAELLIADTVVDVKPVCASSLQPKRATSEEEDERMLRAKEDELAAFRKHVAERKRQRQEGHKDDESTTLSKKSQGSKSERVLAIKDKQKVPSASSGYRKAQPRSVIDLTIDD